MFKSRRSFLSLIGCAAAAPLAGNYEAAQARPDSVQGGYGLRVPAGHLVVVGYDMVNDCPNKDIVCWNDPATGSWMPDIHNDAGSWCSPYPLVGPATLSAGGVITIPSNCCAWEMVFQGHPFVYGFHMRNVTAQPMEAI